MRGPRPWRARRPAGPLIAGALLVAILFSGCELFGAETSVTLELPGPPPRWPGGVGVSSYRIIWRGPDGRAREAEVDGRRRGVELRVPKRDGLAVLVYPRSAGDRFAVRPAAAVYPHDARGTDVLASRYEHGFAGLVLHRALFSVPTFNSARLIEEVTVRGDGDPWAFDLDRVVEKLVAGAFSTIYLRPRDRFPVELSVAPGVYVRDDPFRPAVSVTSTDPVIRAELTPGVHRFLRVDERVILTVSVGKDGALRIFER